jgi:hypothetical protein
MARQTRPDEDPEVVVGRPHPGDDWSEQPYREAAALALAADFAVSRAPGRTTLLVSDCAPAVQAFTRGSPSPPMQRPAARAARAAASSDSRVVVLWVPGKELVDIGVDDLSRSRVHDLHDVQLHPDSLVSIFSLAEAYLGGRPTVDWFASSASAKLPRFWSRFWQPGAEGLDAFLAPSWSSSPCSCGSAHQEIGLFFPPVPLLSKVWSRIKQEGALGIIIVPRTPGEQWWPLLEESSLASIDIPEGFLHHSSAGAIYSSPRMAWQAHVFSFGLRVFPDQCAAFRQAGGKPPTSATLHADAIRASFLAPALAARAPVPRSS